MQKYISLLFVVAFGSASVLLTNGNFEQDLSIGWVTAQSGYGITINRGTTYEPDADYEVYALVDSSGGGCAKVYQTVDIPTTDLSFSIKAKMHAYDNNADALCWAGAAIVISYLDGTGNVLGDTRIYRMTDPCPWANSSTRHLISAVDTLWHTYSFNVNSELANLPGVNPASVKKVSVCVFDTTAHTC
jgi:hypothetical protein